MAVSAAQDEKKKALNLAIAQIEKSYGRGAIMKMGPDGTTANKGEDNEYKKGQGTIKSGNVNVPGGKAALQKVPTADRTKEGKFATGGGVPVNSKSEIGGKVR